VRFSSQGKGQHSAFSRPTTSIRTVPVIPLLLDKTLFEVSSLITPSGWKKERNGFCENLKNLNAHRGFTSAVVAPPNAITPEQVIRHYRYKPRGGLRGQARSPPSSYQCFVFHTLMKEILQNQKMGILNKTFEPLFFNFADRADSRWLFAGAEIPADSTTPDRQ
jgi:hypothetical protein